MPNRLRDEPSPYLRQHADNPVDWYPWGKPPFDLALAQDRPILLSIGYSACHWCHVMAHESFEDAETAALMNQRFINIKVDREEHPDVDQLYQHALQVVSEQGGGWPLTMFLLPTGEPFFGGTYFPPSDRYGRPSFRRVLGALAQAYKDQPDEVRNQGRAVVDALSRTESRARSADAGAPLLNDYAERAALRLAQRMDLREGGFQGAPKFPNPSSLELQLRGAYRATDDTGAGLRATVLLTLRKMADGGIHDQLGGGFARYSTDEGWLVPHFEKMLYDNGQLLRLYAEGAQVSNIDAPSTDAVRFGQVAQGILQWLEREMRDSADGLYAAQDADSEGVEGKYFVWSPPEVQAELARALGPEQGAKAAAVLCRCYDVRPGGNWRDPHGHGPKGQSILHIVDAPLDEAEAALLQAGTAALLAARLLRVPPGTDDKVLAGWNGLAVTGLAEAGRIFGSPQFIAAARRTADFLLQHMWSPEAGLKRTYRNGAARLPGTMDDHAFVAEGLIYLSGATGEGRYLEAARRIMNSALDRLYDGAGGFYMAPEAGAGEVALPMRPRSLHDSAIPAGMSVACSNLLRLVALLPPDAIEVRRYRQVAEQVLSLVQEQALRNPFGLSSACAAIDLMQHGLTETIIVAPTATAAEDLLAVTRQVYVPDHFVLSHVAQAPVAPEWAHLLEGKALQGGRPTAYVCRGESCSAPVTEPAALRELLYNHK